MKNYTFNFEVQTLLEQFVAAFNDIIIKRYDNTKTVMPSSSAIKVDFVYAPKQRVYDTLNTPSPGGLTVPVVAVNISGITRDAKRVFNKLEGFYIETGDNGDGSLIKKIPQPVPVNIGINMTIVTKLQSDMDQIVSNFVPYCDPYIIISWKLPNPKNPKNSYEIRSEVLWDGNINLNYPDNLAANQPYRLTATTNFTIKGWLFKKMDDVVKKIYTIDSKLISTDGTTAENDIVNVKPSIIKDFDTVFGVNQGITVSDFSIQTTPDDIKNFKNTYSIVYGNSGNWDSVYSVVEANSATNWLGGYEAYNNLISNSAFYLGGKDLTFLLTTSGNWESTYSTVKINSATNWEGGYEAYTNLIANSSAYLSSVDLGFLSLSSNWDSVYSTVQINSSINWFGGYEAYTNLIANSSAYLSSVDLGFLSLSSNWDSVYSTVEANSSTNWLGGYEAYTNLIANSSAYLSSVDLSFLSLSSNWNSVYTTVEINSATNWLGGYEAYTNLIANSSAYLSSVDLRFLSLSSNWNSVYSTVQNNSSTNWLGGYEAYTNLSNLSTTYASVTSINGTIYEIDATNNNGKVILSIPSSFRTPGDLNVGGNLYVAGSSVKLNTATLTLSSPILYLNNSLSGGAGNVFDIGFVGHFKTDRYQHTGLVRSAQYNYWSLFSGLTSEPQDSPTLDYTNPTFTIDTLRANILGSLSGNVVGNITGNAESVTNGVYINQNYSDPSWITSLADSKIQGPSRNSWDSVYSYVNQNSGIEENQILATSWVIANSANSESVYSTVQTNSSINWQGGYEAYTNLIANSSAYLSAVNLSFLSLSSNWDSVYSTVQNNSSTNWLGGREAYTNLIANSSAYLSAVNLSFLSLSSNWNSTYSTVQSNSTVWTGAFLMQSSNFNTIVGRNYLVNTTSNIVNGTLPSSPNIGDKIEFADPYGSWGTYPFVLNNNGNAIQSVNEPLTANIPNYSFKVIYVDIVQGWRIF